MVERVNCRCIRDYYWNLTSPYFRFKRGEVYECLVRTLSDGYVAYCFEFCDALFDYDNFGLYFMMVDDYRQMRINNILDTTQPICVEV